MTSFGRRNPELKVFLNIYDLTPINQVLHPIGFGIHHTGVEIFGSEYTFASDAGIFHHTPRAVPNAQFREQIEIGIFVGGGGGLAEVKSILAAMGDTRFGPNDYHILRNNCNHFANEFCCKLTQRPIPGYVNRISAVGVCCECLIPKQMLGNGAPVRQHEEESSSLLLTRRAATTTATVTAFAGTGSKLGGGGSSASSNKLSSSESLTDRRERARAAALARLELNQQQNDSDKSL
jgi:deubiquitinase DESI2